MIENEKKETVDIPVDEEMTTEEIPKEEVGTEETKSEKKQKKSEQKEIDSLKQQLEEMGDKYMRLAAEYDNFRKRSVKEKSDIYTDSCIEIIKHFLPLMDTMEKAIEFSPEDENITAINKQLDEILARMGVTPIESDGVEFDPNLHNAIAHEEDDSGRINMVTETFQRGFIYKEKVIRYAVVKVIN